MKLHERIKAAREYAGLTQEQMAVLLKTNQSAVSRYESGATMPSLHRLEDMAHVTSVNPTWLIIGMGSIYND